MYSKIYVYRKQDTKIFDGEGVMSENYSDMVQEKTILYLQNLIVLLFKN